MPGPSRDRDRSLTNPRDKLLEPLLAELQPAVVALSRLAGPLRPYLGLEPPGYDPALADVAVIVFDEPIEGVKPALLPQADTLDAALMQEVEEGPFDVGLVGYGTTSFAAASGGAPFDGGTRRFTTMELDTVYPAVATLAPAPGDTCFFDSGGPAFPTVAAHVPPVVVTLHGIIVGPARADMVCGGGTTIMRLDAPHVSSWLRDMIDD